MSQLKQAIAGLHYLVFRSIMFIPFETIRNIWLRPNLKKLGKGSFVCRQVEFFKPRWVSIGKDCVINKGAFLDGRGTLTIGDHVDIARDVLIWTSSHDINDPNHATFERPVVIENHAWIGSRAIIMPGVTIGRGAVVGAGSVVTKDVPPLAVVAGVPAKQIGTRKNDLNYRLDFHPWFT